MSDNALELARLWIQKAENDLVTARQTLLLLDGPTDTVGEVLNLLKQKLAESSTRRL